MGTLVVDPDDELVDGRLGRATSGEFAGYLVLLEQYSDDAWLLYWSNPKVTPDNAVVGRDVGDRLLANVVDARKVLDEELAVRWLAEPEATTLKQRFFSHTEPERSLMFTRLSRWLRRRSEGQ